MSTSAKAKTEFESGQSVVDYTAMTDSGDHKTFTVTGGTVFSSKSGFEASVRPNGIVTGRNLLSTHASDDTVTVGEFTAYSMGVLQEVSSTSAEVVRPASGKYNINSIYMTSSGTIGVVTGTDGDAFSSTRDADGGPPYIPVDGVELGQVRLSDDTSDVIAASEISQADGTSAQRFDFPVWEVNPIGEGDAATVSAKKYAHIEFASELPANFTGGTVNKVYISYNTPVMAELSRTLDFTPAENSHSVTSTQYYNGTIGSVTSTLGQGGFTALMSDNVTDSLVSNKDQVLTVKFYPDRNKTPYILTQGTVGLARTFPVGAQNQATVTISAETPSAEFAS